MSLARSILVLSSALSLLACDVESLDGMDSTEARAAVESDLVHLREEEKLARDVYLTLHEAWGNNVFVNIAQSEQSHMDAVKGLLDRYGLEDPIGDDEIGVFEDEELQGLFDDLVAQGLQSELEALQVGATIEDLDIFDIRKMRARSNDAAVLEVYDSLECGSNNHIRSFTDQLDALDFAYEVQFIAPVDYEAILADGHESCGTGRG